MELAIAVAIDPANPDVGDMLLSAKGEEVRLTSLDDEVCQRLFVRFQFFKGEWFLDLDAGTAYYQLILVKGPSDRVIRAVFNNVIARTEGVRAITRFSYSINRYRQLSLNFTCLLEDGTTFRTEDYPPFVIQT
jgi:hypothetical protein